MSNPVPSGRSSFEENISTLLDELLLAAQWNRPSILLAVHKSKFGQDKAEKALEDRLSEHGHRVTRITVGSDRGDVTHLVMSTPAPEQAIFFISNIDWGDGEDRRDAYRALNIYREFFVENHVKAVFWLTVNEASSLARYAPDFWAFRHRVIEFTGQHIPRKVNLPAGILLWDMENSVDPFDTLQARIQVREELLSRLPNRIEARSARIDLLYNLGYLHWLMDEPGKAEEQFNAALDLAGQAHAGRIRSSILNGLAVISYEKRDCQRAADLLQAAVQGSPGEPHLLINQSSVVSALGRHQEAIALAKKAIKLAASDPRVWSTLGYIYVSIGKPDESITCFAKAAELAPRAAIHHAALAICYDLVERPDEVKRELELARTLARGTMPLYLDLYEAALLGNGSKAVILAQSAIGAGQLLGQDLRRDPNLSLLLDSSKLDEIAG